MTKRDQTAGEAPSSTPASGSARTPVLIELSEAQVDRVVRSALGTGNMSVLLSGPLDASDLIEAALKQMDDVRLSRSLLFGLLLLAVFPADGSYLGVVEIARMLELSASTVHRYVTTLVAVGLLERDPTTRKYRLMDAG
jgi:IclR helix-turn-helix domain